MNAIGFREMLGEVNVLHGTDLHKRVLREWLSQKDALRVEEPRVLEALRRAFQTEAEAGRRELFALVRRCVLRASIESRQHTGPAASGKTPRL